MAKSVLGDAFHDDDFAERMVEAAKLKKKAEAERKAKKKRDKPWTRAQIRDYMRTFVKNQGCAMYGSGWTKKKFGTFDTLSYLQNMTSSFLFFISQALMFKIPWRSMEDL